MSEEDPRFSSGAFENGIAKRGSSRSGDLHDKSLPELLKQASEQTASLVRKEIELAKAEMTVKGKRVGWAWAPSAPPASSGFSRLAC
jgi:Putative Actinobacterial Holin-X, holin superfamily III